MTCDAHTHFFSRDLFLALAGQAAAASGRPASGLLDELITKTGLELPSESTAEHVERWITELDRHGVQRAVSFASAPPEAAAVLEAGAASEGRLIPYLVCDPSTGAGVDATISGLRDGGRGVLLFPAIGRFDPSDEILDGLYEEAASRRAPVVVHCGVLQIKLRDLLGVRPRYDIRCATPLSVSAAAERHRGVSFVLPHFGGGFFREALIAGAQSPNVLVDTSSSNSWMATQEAQLDLENVFARALGVFGPERILFGTDSCTFPRGWRSDLFEAQDAALDGLGVDARTKRRIFGENLLSLLDSE